VLCQFVHPSVFSTSANVGCITTSVDTSAFHHFAVISMCSHMLLSVNSKYPHWCDRKYQVRGAKFHPSDLSEIGRFYCPQVVKFSEMLTCCRFDFILVTKFLLTCFLNCTNWFLIIKQFDYRLLISHLRVLQIRFVDFTPLLH